MKTLRKYMDLITEMENGQNSPLGGGVPQDRKALAARQIERDSISEETDEDTDETGEEH